MPRLRSEVTILIDLPPGVRAKDLSIAIREAHVTVGIKGLPPYLDVRSCVRFIIDEPLRIFFIGRTVPENEAVVVYLRWLFKSCFAEGLGRQHHLL